MDMKLEVVVVPVADVDRARSFYESLGWRPDANFAGPDGYENWPDWYAQFMLDEQGKQRGEGAGGSST